jgi:hypothetical protein
MGATAGLAQQCSAHGPLRARSAELTAEAFVSLWFHFLASKPLNHNDTTGTTKGIREWSLASLAGVEKIAGKYARRGRNSMVVTGHPQR